MPSGNVQQGGAGSDRGFRIISGGQSGADRAALDAALAAGVPCGGWCPAGRWAEDGRLADRYPLTETREADPLIRTRHNVADADATLILTLGILDAGSRATLAAAEELHRPCLVLDLADRSAAEAARDIRRWLAGMGVRTLNVAGPRESNAPGIAARARAALDVLLEGGLSGRR